MLDWTPSLGPQRKQREAVADRRFVKPSISHTPSRSTQFFRHDHPESSKCRDAGSPWPTLFPTVLMASPAIHSYEKYHIADKDKGRAGVEPQLREGKYSM